MILRIWKVSTVMPFFTSKRLRNVGQREAIVINQKLTVSWLHVNEWNRLRDGRGGWIEKNIYNEIRNNSSITNVWVIEPVIITY